MKVLEALECIRDYCKSTTVQDCNNRRCTVYKILGDCVFSTTPEEWELNTEECDE